jgi:ribokinase
MKMDVVGFGALNLDKLFQVNRIAHEDEESYITGKSESCGGSAANTIVGLARLGMETGFIGKVATDREGSLLHNNLQNENINTNGVVVTDNGRSGTVNGFVDSSGQRALYVDPGVNDDIDIDEVELDYINSSKVLHITSFVGKSDEKSIKTQKTVLNEISTNVSVSFDPGRLYTERGLDFLENFLIRTDILLINQSELKLLITGNIEDSRKSTEKYETQEIAEKVQLEYGIDTVVVKMGDKGSYVTHKGKSHIANAFDVPCVDTTGAGDAFNAGFLHGYVNGEDIKKMALKGNYIASCCVTEHGTTNGLPDLTKLENIINNQ